MRSTDPKERKSNRLRRLAALASGAPAAVSVAEALEFRRDQYELTKREFAGVLGLRASHYSEVVNGRRRLPIDATRRAFAIGVPAHVLLQPQPSGD